jgi:hypothetical protein
MSKVYKNFIIQIISHQLYKLGLHDINDGYGVIYLGTTISFTNFGADKMPGGALLLFHLFLTI